MHALPIVIAALVAASLARPLLRALEGAGAMRTNYRGRRLAFPLGLLIPAAAAIAVLALTALSPVVGGVFHAELAPAALLCGGVVALGLLDDALGRRGATAPRGLRGHAAALRAGTISTGAAKALGTLAL